ncbi:MAG: cation-efflux pump, partial [Vallitaleaceae bacterium]|nr:cation-efflux pump [Vallitaleaceae bacterium]
DDIATMKLRRMVEMIVGIAEPLAHIHDFRIVHQEERTKMVFDVVVPHTYKEAERLRFHEQLLKDISEVDAEFECIITVENSFISEVEQ